MTKTIYRIRKDDKGKKLLLSFGERKTAEIIAKRLDFKIFIEEVLFNDEGKIIKTRNI